MLENKQGTNSIFFKNLQLNRFSFFSFSITQSELEINILRYNNSDIWHAQKGVNSKVIY